MIRLALIAWLALCGVANAQLSGGVGGFPGPGTVHTSATYSGPGDVVSGAIAWGSCARVYNASLASTATSLCDLVAVTGGAAVCTLRGSSSGFVDLAASYCAGTTPAAACAAASGGSCKITKVYDQTGTGNHFTQGTLANMPGLVFSALNSLPGLQCGGTSIIATPTITQAQPFSATAVFTRTSGAAIGGALGAGSGAVLLIGSGNLANTARIGGSAQVQFSATDSAWHALNGHWTGASSAYNIDGSDVTSQNFGTSGFSSNAMRLCSDGTNVLAGQVMEGGLWPSGFNSTQRGDMNTNQHGLNGYNF